MNVVILQPSYIPWRGYFDQIQRADLFIFYDDVQYDKRGWRNRNQIKTARGKQWLTIPVYSHGAQTQNIPINQIRIVWDNPWNVTHLKAIQHSYCKVSHFNRYRPLLETFYQRHDEYLADFTIDFSIALTRELGNTHTRFMRSSEIAGIDGQKTDRLIQILKSVGATHFISGPSARDYIESEKFDSAGITLEYMQYNYPEYVQLYPPFDPQVSVLDLLFMTGPEAPHYIFKGSHV
ncbi:MAG TPA: WbqC family protein [Anaerolineales bacterium]|nr:WbqC family protein [Anaerolineales bacterium]